MTTSKPKPKEPFNSIFPEKERIEIWRQKLIAINKPKPEIK